MKAETHIRGWSLSTVLQMVEMDKRTCTLKVQSGENVGLLFFRTGSLVHAESGPLRGIDAAFEIVNWDDDFAIEVDGACGPDSATIDLPITRLLLEGLTRKDERRRDEATQTGGGPRGPAYQNGSLHDPATPQAIGLVFDFAQHLSEEDDVSKLQAVLDKFREEVPEFVSTDIVNIDSGLSIGGGTLDPDFDASIASASYSEVVKSNRRALELLGLGAESTEDILITTGKVSILIRMLGGEYYHLVAITRRGNLGFARAIMKKYEASLLQAVGQLS